MKKRLEQNLADFSVLDTFADAFYAFVDNNGDADETAREVLGAFCDFSSGKPKDSEAIFNALRSVKQLLKQQL